MRAKEETMTHAAIAFTHQEGFTGEGITNIIRSAVDHASDFEQLRFMQEGLKAEKDRLQLLLDLATQLAPDMELQQLLRTASATIRRITQCDLIAIHLPDKENGSLRVSTPGTWHDGGQAVRQGDNSGEAACESFRTRSLMLAREGTGYLMPLLRRSRILGVLELNWRKELLPREIDFLKQIADQVSIAIENAFSYAEARQLKEQLSRENLYREDEVQSEQGFEDIVGRSSGIRAVLRNIELVAPTNSTVLIYGETGTGKELIARAIHERSPRSSKPFVKLNCAAIPTGLLESELFGHERGAFTGAIMQRIGRFELANHGTAFLDEIGEISLELQPKLLRVLQEREFERLGSARTIKTDARLIAATNRNLADCVQDGTFRADLFYRLNIFPIHAPALRERREDIPLLVRHFAQQCARRMNRAIEAIASETMEELVRYPWPGNIRELQNVIERSVILSPGPTLRVPSAALGSRCIPDEEETSDRTLNEAEREHIISILKKTNWVVAGAQGAAVRLGMNRSTLQSRMKKLGIIVRPCMQ
jgi:formate hydrogenlyase transcriptional activator